MCRWEAILGTAVLNWRVLHFQVVRRGLSRSSTLDFWQAYFGLFRRLADRTPWETVLKGQGAQHGWTILKQEILEVLEQAFLVFCMTSLAG